MLEWRLKAYRHWLTMTEPRCGRTSIIRRSITRTSSTTPPPSRRSSSTAWTKSIPKLLKTFEKLGIPLDEQKRLTGVAVDAVFDSVSVATTFKEKLAELGIIFCSFSEAVQNHPELVEKYLGSVVPYTDNYFAALNSAVFTDGSFCYIPKGVRCPMELSTYFRINAQDTGQFERTLIIAEEGATSATSKAAPRRCATRTSCTPPWSSWSRSDERADQVFDRAELVSRRQGRQGRHLQLRDQARRLPRPQLARSPGRRSKPARPSPGNIRAASCRATIRSASSTPSR